jgi:amino acid permease
VGEFGMLIAFVGGITDALQGFVLPPLIHRATHWTSLGTIKRRMLLALSFLGISLMLSATYQNGLAFQAIRESQAAQELVLWGHGWGGE